MNIWGKKNKMITLFRHHVYQKSIDNVTEVLKSGWTGLGPRVAEFEQAVSQYLNTPYVIALNSGTAAIQIALACLKAPKGSYVITTPLTFIATNHCILQAGYYPVFADIEPDTGNIDPKSIERLMTNPFINSRAKAIMVVHFGGMPVDMNAIYDIATKYHLDVIEDSSHAFGAEYQNEKIGCLHSRFCTFSLHSVKPLAIGDGGLLTTYDPEIDKMARLLRWFGINKNTSERTNNEKYSWDYDIVSMGWKNHMNDIQAAIGLGQLQHYEEDRIYRQMLVDKYRKLLANTEQIELLKIFPDRISANHLFVILVNNRDKLMKYLSEQGIQCGVHYRLNHLYKMYRTYETDNGCQEAIKFFERCISLPLHVELSEDNISFICEKIQENK
jgi:perosamine synthetase